MGAVNLNRIDSEALQRRGTDLVRVDRAIVTADDRAALDVRPVAKRALFVHEAIRLRRSGETAHAAPACVASG